MSARALIVALLFGAVVATGVIVDGGQDDRYRVTLRLANAGGLESGSPVVIGGLTVGEVELELDGDDVLAHLDIEDKHAPVGRDATATIAAQNLLGQKQVRITPGTTTTPAPDGTVLTPAKVRSSSDLDQVLDVLGPDTRARLAILMSEAGSAVTGRKVAVDTFVGNFPEILERGAALADEFASGNRVLRDLVSKTDRYVATLAEDRTALTRAVDRVGQTAVTVAERRRELRQTLQTAPPALRNLRGFLLDLRESAAPLGRTARNLQAVAEPLRTTLGAAPAFQRAASPTLDAAVAAAPELTRLGEKVAPVLRRAQPTLRSAAALTSTELPPVANIVDRSFSNLLAILENWSRAIQYRDRLSHVFRAELGVPLITLTSAVDRIVNASRPAKARKRAARRPAGPPAQSPSAPPAPAPAPKRALPKPVQDAVDDVAATVDSLLGEVGGTLNKLPGGRSPSEAPAPGDGPTSSLLDFLLGP